MSRSWTWLLVVLPLVAAGCATWDETQNDDDDDDDCAASDDDVADDDDDDAADDDAADDDDDVADDDDDVADDDDDVADDDDDVADDDDDTVGTDGDGDGFTVADGDCNDANASIYPGAPEACDGLDNDCNAVVPPDEIDGDLDGYAPCAGDCDDFDLWVNPSQAEIPNDGVDNDCDGTADPEWIPIAATPDPAGDHNGYLIDISMHEYSQVGSRLRFKTTSHQVFSDLSVMVDMYVSNGTDTYTLTYDSNEPDPLQLWSDTNGWAAPLTSPASLNVDYDAADTLIMGIDMADLGLGGVDEMDVWVGVDLGLLGAYSDQFPDATSATVPLGAAAALTVDDVQFFEVSGNGDLYIDPNELWHVEVHLENVGDLPTSNVTGTLNATTDVNVAVGTSNWSTLLPGDISAGSPWFRVGIEPTASSIETLTLDLSGTGGDNTVNVDIPIGWGFPDAEFLRYEYTYWVSGSTAWGDMTVTILDSAQDEVCDHVFEFDADYAYGTGQGGFWPDAADETIQFTNITDSGLGSCPAGYHDLYNVTPNEMLLSTNTVLAFISCDIATAAFHGDDVITGAGTGSQDSWCQDVGPVEAGNFGTGDAEAISLMVMDYGALSGIGTFNYYVSGDGAYYWGHLGMLMKDAGNFTDPLFGMWGDYFHIVHWVFII